MSARKLTAAMVKRLPAPDKRTDIKDAGESGLYLRVTPAGRKTWRCRYTYRGKERYMNLGTYPGMKLAEARTACREVREQAIEGIDPAAEIQRAQAERDRMPTVAEFVDEYIERYAKPNKSSWHKDEQALRKNIVPVLGQIPMDEVKRRDLVGALDIIRDRGAEKMADRCYAYTRRMFRFAVERGIIDTSPAQYIRMSKSNSREVVLSDEAIRHLWAATAPYGSSEYALPMHHATRVALRLLLLTGQRNIEVSGIRRAELNLDRRIWMLPRERTKNGMSQTVPLSDPVMAIIQSALPHANEHFLLPANSKLGHLTIYANIQAMGRIFDGWEPRYIPHDMRRTVGTRLPGLGISRLIADKALNHKDGSVSGIYDRHSYDKEKREALDIWACELKRLVGEDSIDEMAS